MAKMTKLNMVQKILAIIGETSVQTIGDTIESEKVATLVDIAYDDLLYGFNWPFLYRNVQLEITPSRHIMNVPQNLYTIEWIRYNGKKLTQIDYERMLERYESQKQMETSDTVGAITDRDPSYWCVVNDNSIYFDSYNGSLIPILSSVYGTVLPEPMVGDNAEPAIPARFHNVLLYLSAAQALFSMKGDDSLGNKYYALYRKGIVDMKRWAKLDNNPSRTDSRVNYGRRILRRNYDFRS